ncbi:DUF6807 family protein [Aeoliella mucimassa]|uniref:Methane oxygenase PmoA n=1 Tax=Aeoliella mucimassa TaxID=2527972 RepID=A0A518ATX1_9BACT|nr:DUF6807 family protein [Aeoliella mucimassa]QDU58145.1 hypothetical protein Pan181_43720 [Aeoliella mucimassa]
MNITTPFRSSALAALSLALLATLIPTAAQAGDSAYTWADNEEKHECELTLNGSPLVRYMYAPIDESNGERRAETYKPYLHVFSPDGSKIITKGPGGLFPHHRGIFYGFNRITYGDGKKCDTWHCHGKAFTEHERFSMMESYPTSGAIESVVYWHGQEGEVFATEERTMQVGQVDGMTQIDFVSTLTPAKNIDKIHLDGDPQHAGVQFRASQKVPDETAKQTYYLRPDGKGKEGETRNWDQNKPDSDESKLCIDLPWHAVCFVLDGERYTVVRCNHPENPKPARYSERDYARFGSYFATDVTPEKPLTVKYRFVVKQGELTVDECKAICDGFVAAE